MHLLNAVWKWNPTDPTLCCFMKNGCDDKYPCPPCVTGFKPLPPPPPTHVVFTCGTPSLSTLTVFNDSSYIVAVGGDTPESAWFTDGDVAFFSQGSWYGVNAQTLQVVPGTSS